MPCGPRVALTIWPREATNQHLGLKMVRTCSLLFSHDERKLFLWLRVTLLFYLSYRELGRCGFAAAKSHFERKCGSVCVCACTCVHVSMGMHVHTRACLCVWKRLRMEQEAEVEGRVRTNTPPSLSN